MADLEAVLALAAALVAASAAELTFLPALIPALCSNSGLGKYLSQ